MGADAMISLQCSSSESIARELNQYLQSKGISTWMCIEMHGGTNYREEIVINAAGSKAMVALMNIKWAESKECRYEFNIALRTHLTKGAPAIIPIIVENFDWNAYPLLIGVMSNTNAIFYNPKSPQTTWEQVIGALASFGILPGSFPSEHKQVVPISSDTVNVTELPEKISEWNSKHVAQWLRALDFQAPVEAFQSNWVDGPILLEITQQDLVDSLKLTNLQAKRLMREITSVKKVAEKSAQTQNGASGVPIIRGNTQTKICHSKQGFVTGIWEGYYQYPLSESPNNSRDPTNMDVTMVAGVIAGYGSDVEGEFLIQGVYDDETLSISWDKTYVGKHTILYQGKLHNHCTIEGSWKSKLCPDFGGPFALTKKDTSSK